MDVVIRRMAIMRNSLRVVSMREMPRPNSKENCDFVMEITATTSIPTMAHNNNKTRLDKLDGNKIVIGKMFYDCLCHYVLQSN